MKKKTNIILSAGLILVLLVALTRPAERYFEIAKSLEIYTTLFKEVNAFYVDDIKPEELVRKSIDGMLETLDPYTTFIPEEDVEDFKISTTGRYGGIGSVIGVVNNKIVITGPYEGFPAYKAGLKVGDELIEVDGVSIRDMNTSDVSTLLKGQPGTTVSVKIKRPGTGEELEMRIPRQRISIENVPYHDMIASDIGYILLSDFTPGAGKEVESAVKELKGKGAKKIILDLRDNPGGMLHEAVNIANVFLPKNVEVVSTRGKVADWNKSYQTLNAPVDTNIPLVVLVNGNSASASEIVAGSLQDYDRAVLVGQRTFGKGLVQTTRPLAYDAQIKITTAKYYIPSGRCIQELDYAHRQADGTVEKFPDSLRTEFKTQNGRSVYDGGGLAPDVAVESEYVGSVTKELISSGLLFEYAAAYANTHPAPKDLRSFRFTAEDYNQFVNWLGTQKFSYAVPMEKEADALMEAAKQELYFKDIEGSIKSLRGKIVANKKSDYERFGNQIKMILEHQIAFNYGLIKGKVEASFDDDKSLQEAFAILNDPAKYNNVLAKQ